MQVVRSLPVYSTYSLCCKIFFDSISLEKRTLNPHFTLHNLDNYETFYLEKKKRSRLFDQSEDRTQDLLGVNEMP